MYHVLYNESFLCVFFIPILISDTFLEYNTIRVNRVYYHNKFDDGSIL